MSRRQSFAVLSALSLLLVFLAGPALAGETMKAKVIQVADGDTVVVSKAGQVYQVVISGIDAPERSQDYGMEAYEYVRNLAKGEKVMITVLERDGNKILGHVSVQGQDIAASLVSAGLAWTPKGEASAELEKAQEAAKASKEGLWASSDPTPPWEYRRSA